MLLTTLPRLRCPSRARGKKTCAGELCLSGEARKKSGDVLFGTLVCFDCGASFPILAGVAVLVDDVERYLQFHAKGISALVKDSEIPDHYRESYLAAKAELRTGHTEEDLESQRINALYFMNHFLTAKGKERWWRPRRGAFSPEIDRLVRTFWDEGPFAKIAAWTKSLRAGHVVELGCGVGGLARVLGGSVESYLGVDTAFASIALARHVYLDTPYSLPLRIPQDLYQGPLTGKAARPKLRATGSDVDFLVGEIESLPLARESFDLCVALNAIDMIEDPRQLPELQRGLLREGGVAIQSCPYIWHKKVAERLRKSLPGAITSSSAAVEHLYEKAGLRIFRRIDHLPWLFLKHFRQLELYSVHLFAARKVARQRALDRES